MNSYYTTAYQIIEHLKDGGSGQGLHEIRNALRIRSNSSSYYHAFHMLESENVVVRDDEGSTFLTGNQLPPWRPLRKAKSCN
jgi:hypothetical protein